MFEKILIANRGEIAIRVMRACKEMGITPVGVYSECDRCALHVSHAYESYPIGPSPSKESYLSIERILDAAKKSGAEAIHPGYGFLAENADFAEACESEGIVFIGPTARTIRLMGDKLQARASVASSGVKVIPGSEKVVNSPKEAAALAKSIGYPVIIKAAGGGGGKGMRIVSKASEFENALSLTIGEAESAFGSDAVYIEKYIEKPKHIEIQVLADGKGNLVTLGERECSLQRRYQKIIEEAPSVAVTESKRKALSSAAKKAAKAAGYTSAGTVEFMMGQNGEFYFLEMNTRLQVEHPVSEMVYGVDIVKEQIRIAAGEKLGIDQSKIHPIGHAIEARIYAEDPARNFVPSVGMIKRLGLPQGPGVRNENGVYAGYEIPIYYDPLIGKVIAWAEDRPSAIRRIHRALKEYQLDGVRTNVEFLLWAIDEKSFVNGAYDTGTIERAFEPSLLHSNKEAAMLATIAGSITAFNTLKNRDLSVENEDTDGTWKRTARVEGLRKPRI
ncbi:MAG: acetyl-CoA carboxylase biotin carboxylase subunit [Candidatus Latescibacteria bacterium]|nr:acetyl-CoA carboxylase biotin carboxylase subunit [Candidatus Latescibacterota bacterium]NIM22121.1 acetyl-CoA carboxylase biotin carboxylase subunit [Candidatus Latescibacterota bacterium]NIM64671.1 acetyl-CoA carboxylase biotin carboxylase subunit [Candidatus Latescibacterota bacterium]NIO01181.1 acetyl-CoA carboxylase biotin carboxylase subunit [Candidatus Latescibacterota bacterium]NIO27566.1 acetyl-CoA carboxylase biotin carboxylase subunit [Candidatus Latescibacterota bacterium]